MTGFLEKLRVGLGISDENMALILDMDLGEYRSIDRLPRAQLADFDKHHMWERLDTHVKNRMAGLLMVQEELRVKQDKDRRARVVRTARAREIR